MISIVIYVIYQEIAMNGQQSALALASFLAWIREAVTTAAITLQLIAATTARAVAVPAILSGSSFIQVDLKADRESRVIKLAEYYKQMQFDIRLANEVRQKRKIFDIQKSKRDLKNRILDFARRKFSSQRSMAPHSQRSMAP